MAITETKLTTDVAGYGSASQPHRCTVDDVKDEATLPLWSATKPSAAGLLGLSRSSAYNAATIGDLPTIRVVGRILVPTAALLRMLAVD